MTSNYEGVLLALMFEEDYSTEQHHCYDAVYRLPDYGVFKISTFISTGCPKSSFLYFVSLYFSTIGLVKQIKSFNQKLCLSI